MINNRLPRIRQDYPSLFPMSLHETPKEKYRVHSKLGDGPINDGIYIHLVTPAEEQTAACHGKLSVWIETLRGDPSKREMIMGEFKQAFHCSKSSSRLFDLHERLFQDFALEITCGMDSKMLRQLSVSHDHADKRVLRGRVYAISSRENVGWDGRVDLTEEEVIQKRRDMLDHLKSLTLYDWYGIESTNLLTSKVKRGHSTKIRVLRLGTQEAVEQVVNEPTYSGSKVAWVNFANSHNVCGAYSVDYGGSQEEEVATNCDAAALLGTMGEVMESGIKTLVRGRWVGYRENFHIPPGGNYTVLTRFVTGVQQVECTMIAAAFADFRSYVPFFTPYSERNYFYSYLGWGSLRNEKELEQRLILDIEGGFKDMCGSKYTMSHHWSDWLWCFFALSIQGIIAVGSMYSERRVFFY